MATLPHEKLAPLADAEYCMLAHTKDCKTVLRPQVSKTMKLSPLDKPSPTMPSKAHILPLTQVRC
jgi:hypothetical protein